MSGNLNSKHKIFYGWWIVLAGGIGMSLSAGITFHGFGNFVIPLSNEFGWSRTTISTVISIGKLQSGIFGPLEGWAVDKFGPRRLMFIGIPILGLGYVLLSTINTLAAFYVVYLLLITLGSNLSMGMPIIASVANWFKKRRGLAFGLAWSGVGLGGLFVPLIGWMVDQFGWRDTSLYIGIGLSIIGFPIASVIRHKPEQYGYLPDGESHPNRENKTAAEADMRLEREGDFNAKEALRSTAFWLISLSIAARMLSSSGLALHMIPYLSGLGASTIGAATLAGSVSLMSIPGRFGLGLLSDHINSRYLMAVCLAAITASFMFISQASTIIGTIPALMIYAVAQGGVAVIPQTMLADYFGRNSYATIQGLRGSIQMVGVLGGPILAGYIFDKTQSYKHAFELFAIATAISMVLMLMASPPQKRKTNTSPKNLTGPNL